jgi:threonine dehydrogenase-like Zn-dependent dehydrogenase
VPASAVILVPDAVPPGRAVLAANLETAVNVVWDARALPGDRIIVVGGGVIGLLVAWLCGQIPGVSVTVVDINPARADAARALGVPLEREVPRDANADVVVHASGRAEGLEDASGHPAQRGKMVEKCMPPLFSVLLSRRISIAGGKAR